ncbi:hypothetical protein B6D60_03200 [candidate division KSB1 bacterium 4484_87]|nr:MAG: hypothetical protein B6D60_03200 [candidate division KSB1 bacterium 4484_87]
MRIRMTFFFLLFLTLLIFSQCSKKDDLSQFQKFNQQFLATQIPEVPDPRLLTKEDLPAEQQKYFDENGGTLQMLLDINQNGVPEYLICGVSKSLLEKHEHRAYFFAIFEQTENGIERKFLQRLNAPPVNLKASGRDKHSGVLLIFAFSSNFAAEIYYEGDEYKLERWF